ncbi:uncharacterized protein LOC120192961 [Hibiscus syriacus]|uniref:uncharacterized protein LOC120192961 n=1 Tax=Hibiscus syriacus TaxID=106335 RepID=UPI0019248687|nr:uncharacterized protein LOC120192961 [Hibiscus syriacus]
MIKPYEGSTGLSGPGRVSSQLGSGPGSNLGSGCELQYDPEIEKTARKLRKETNLRSRQDSFSSSPESKSALNLVDSSSDSEIEGTMANEERTLRELAAPNMNQQPLDIDYPTLEVAFELKYGLIHLLLTFHGLENKDPHKHLKEFHAICSSMRPQGVTEEVASIRREICGIKQKDTETLHEYWERFKRLCASCPQHGISEQLLIQYFYEGLLPMERKMIDAASGGAIVNKTPRDARELTSNMAANSQQFDFRQDTSSIRVNKQVKACGICVVIGYPTDMCPTLQDDSHEYTNADGRFTDPPQRKYDPYLNIYNLGWRDHPNLSYGPRPSQFHLFPPEQSSSKPCMSLEEIVKSLATNTQQFQQETRTIIQNLDNQISQLASSVSQLESQGKPYSQTIVNPKQNANTIALRSEKKLKEPSPLAHGRALEEETEKEVVAPQTKKDQHKALESEQPKALVINPPFPARFTNFKKQAEEKEILETFRKIEVNIPLLDAIKQVPRYTKFVKELCTNNRKLKGNEKD